MIFKVKHNLVFDQSETSYPNGVEYFQGAREPVQKPWIFEVRL
jgi:hypothetical protein